jgi:hypothetical protein
MKVNYILKDENKKKEPNSIGKFLLNSSINHFNLNSGEIQQIILIIKAIDLISPLHCSNKPGYCIFTANSASPYFAPFYLKLYFLKNNIKTYDELVLKKQKLLESSRILQIFKCNFNSRIQKFYNK